MGTTFTSCPALDCTCAAFRSAAQELAAISGIDAAIRKTGRGTKKKAAFCDRKLTEKARLLREPDEAAGLPAALPVVKPHSRGASAQDGKWLLSSPLLIMVWG